MTQTIHFTCGKHGRSDRYYPACALSELLCSIMRRDSSLRKAQCLVDWQIEKLKKFGFKVEIEEE